MKKTLRSILAILLLLGCFSTAQGYGVSITSDSAHYLMAVEYTSKHRDHWKWTNLGGYGNKKACVEATFILKLETWACVPIWPK